jgi:multiple sugar transport system ATP-binding protein
MSELQIKGLSKSFGAVRVLHDINLEVHDQEFVVLVGPSGCGKSTLLRLMAGLEDITAGELLIDGQRMNDVPPAERGLAMVFQSYALYPHMSVAENMSVGLRIAGTRMAVIERKVASAAEILQLSNLLDRLPKQLSGGQRQRVAIGRAIVRNPKIFLFDEPLSNLDAALRLQMRLELAKLRHDLKATIVYVTHDQVEAMTLADKIVVMNEGRIEQIGAPLELYRKPVNRFVAGFIGSPKMNFIEAKATTDRDKIVIEVDGNSNRMNLPNQNAMVEGRVTVGIRPEDIRVGDCKENGISANVKVSVVERLGPNSYAYAHMAGGTPLSIELIGTSDVKVGDDLRIMMPQQAVHLFQQDGKAIR